MKKDIFVSEKELDEQKAFSGKAKAIILQRFGSVTPKAFVHTYGCQGNVADSEHIKGMLIEMGYEMCDDVNEADFILYNTCAIREHAEDRVFGNVGAIKKLKKELKNIDK